MCSVLFGVFSVGFQATLVTCDEEFWCEYEIGKTKVVAFLVACLLYNF